MRYVSTRGGQTCGFIQALFRGRAPNGGVYLPQDWPQLTLDDITAAGRRPLAETMATLLQRFAGLELDTEMALGSIREALTVFGHPAVAPLRELDPNLWLLDLARGPTMTSADVEMQVMARLVGRTVADQGRSATLLLATDGDDGPAAVEAFRERAGVGLVVLFPRNGVTAAQRLAMTDARAHNVRAVEVEGDAAACRRLAAAALADEQLASEIGLGLLGPENMGRVAIAAAVLLAAVSRLGAPQRAVLVGAPAENSTVAFAAQALAAMGLRSGPTVLAEGPQGRLAAALQQGRYVHEPAHEAALAAPAWSAAFERLYFEAAERHVVETRRAAQAVVEAGCIDLSPSVRHRMGQVVSVLAVEPGEVEATAMAALNLTGERLDGASAAVIAALRRSVLSGDGVALAPILAHPAWTGRGDAAGASGDLPLQLLRRPAEARCDRLPADVAALGAYLRTFAGLSRAA